MEKFSIRVVILALLLAILAPAYAYAADLTNTSLELGDPRSSETSTYTFNSSGYTTATTIRCLQLVLNDQADGAGSVPNNITTTSSTLDSSTVITAGSWTVDNSSNGTLGATIAGGETPNASGNVVWGGVTNGDTEATTYYGIYTTYTDVSCTGGNEVDTATVAFVYRDGEQVQLIIDPTLTFTCSSVGSAASVNNATTTHASTATGIDYDRDVTSSTNGISAHDLNVTTNAQGGYTVYIRHSGQLTNSGSDTIDNHTGTNGSPTAFPAAGTEAWGYTTEDGTLGGGTADRFTSAGGDKWAGFLTSNEEVTDLTTATPVTQTVRVGHQVGVAANTEAGTYQTTIIYTVVAIY